MTVVLHQRLREANEKKERLKRMIEAERRKKEDLRRKIEEEKKIQIHTFNQKLKKIQEERASLETEWQRAGKKRIENF